MTTEKAFGTVLSEVIAIIRIFLKITIEILETL